MTVSSLINALKFPKFSVKINYYSHPNKLIVIIKLFLTITFVKVILLTALDTRTIDSISSSNNTVSLLVRAEGMLKKSSKYCSSNLTLMPRPLVISGPSGVGKGTLINLLMKQFQDGEFGFSISHTTRLPRNGEENGIHYHFVDFSDMKADITCGNFIEYAQVHGNYYGTSIKAIQSVINEGRVCLIDIDVQGVQQIRNSPLNPFYVFVGPPSVRALEERLRRRGSECENDVVRRINNAMQELVYGYKSGNFDRFLINNNLSKCYETFLKQIIEWYPHLN